MSEVSKSPREGGAHLIQDRETMENVWLDQIDLSLRLAPFTILTGMAVSTIVCFYFWQASTMFYVVGLQGVNVILAVVASHACASWRRGHFNAGAVSVRAIRQRIVVMATLAGFALASIPGGAVRRSRRGRPPSYRCDLCGPDCDRYLHRLCPGRRYRLFRGHHPWFVHRAPHDRTNRSIWSSRSCSRSIRASFLRRSSRLRSSSAFGP